MEALVVNIWLVLQMLTLYPLIEGYISQTLSLYVQIYTTEKDNNHIPQVE